MTDDVRYVTGGANECPNLAPFRPSVPGSFDVRTILLYVRSCRTPLSTNSEFMTKTKFDSHVECMYDLNQQATIMMYQTDVSLRYSKIHDSREYALKYSSPVGEAPFSSHSVPSK
jgi:hypothetical protein